jgi:hypothetical protein
MDIFKQFIEQNPSKVLGQIKNTTDKYGNPDIEVVGDFLTEIQGISSIEVRKGRGLENIPVKTVSETTAVERLKKANDKYEADKLVQKPQPKKGKNKALPRILPAHPEVDLISFDESISVLNGHLDSNVISCWVWYNKQFGLSQSSKWDKYMPVKTDFDWINSMVEQNYLCYDPESNNYVPSQLYYSGNIYEKIEALNRSEHKNKSRQMEGLQSVKPKALVFSEEKSKRLVLSINSLFVREFKIFYNDELQSIYSAFSSYLSNLEMSDMRFFDKRPYQIVNYYLEKKAFKGTEDEKENFKRLASLEVDYQMDLFIQDLDPLEKQKIELVWNRENNGYVSPKYDKIPLGFEYNKSFKDGDLVIRDAQREGVAFQQVKGNGIIAYDVGVGKTMTAILTLGQALENGECKRPLIVVPDPTYVKWITEIYGEYNDEGECVNHGIIPQYPIINLYNLGQKVLDEVFDPIRGLTIDIPEKSITVVTYNGLKKIGFSVDERGEFVEQLKGILMQDSHLSSAREKTKAEEKLNKTIGIGVEGTVINIDEVGWDYLVFDEAHNSNHVFDGVKGEQTTNTNYWSGEKEVKRERSQYDITVNPSALGLKTFFISNYIQRMNNGRNICLLTATPFANNPLEVYSLLAITDFNGLKKLGVSSIRVFFDNYINQTYDRVIDINGSIKFSAVIKGWNNKVALQKILFSYMNYKSGESAKIVRPTKWELPRLSEVLEDGTTVMLPADKQIKTYLQPTPEQLDNIDEISDWLVEQLEDDELKKLAPHLVANHKSKQNTISPYCYKKVDPNTIDPIDFIESSPKLKYTMDCIQSVIKHHEKTKTDLSCCVIYINGCVDYFSLIKRYLIEEIGYKKNVFNAEGKNFDEVCILAGGDVETYNTEQKEALKGAFLDGIVKVIIGSSKIREGIDLQNKSTVLYNLWCDWNPTDYKQLVGRIYRYGNIYLNVRITTPLLIGGSDAFTYQKLEEKTARINDIFDATDDSNILDVQEQDREAVKWALVSDVNALADMMIKDEVSVIEKEISIKNTTKEEFSSYEYLNKKVNEELEKYVSVVSKYVKFVDPEKIVSVTDPIELFSIMARNKSSVLKQIQEVESDQQWNFQNAMDRNGGYYLREHKLNVKKLNRLINYVTVNYGEDTLSNMGSVIGRLSDEIMLLNNEISEKQTPEYRSVIVDTIVLERERLNAGVLSYEKTLKGFTDLNYLLDAIKEKEPAVKKEKPAPQVAPQVTPQVIDVPVKPKVKIKAKVKDVQDSGDTERYELAIEGLKSLIETIEDADEKERYELAIEGMESLLLITV